MDAVAGNANDGDLGSRVDVASLNTDNYDVSLAVGTMRSSSL